MTCPFPAHLRTTPPDRLQSGHVTSPLSLSKSPYIQRFSTSHSYFFQNFLLFSYVYHFLTFPPILFLPSSFITPCYGSLSPRATQSGVVKDLSRDNAIFSRTIPFLSHPDDRPSSCHTLPITSSLYLSFLQQHHLYLHLHISTLPPPVLICFIPFLHPSIT